MKRIKEITTWFRVFIFLSPLFLSGQMIQNGQTLYGNEWMDNTKTYFRFYISEDGIYRITHEKLAEIGISTSDIAKIQLWNYGKQIPINNEQGFIEFVGFRNTIGLDTFMYQNWKKDLLNEDYSLITDDNAYFICIAKLGEPVLRYSKSTTPATSNHPKLTSFQYNQKINLVNTFYKPETSLLRYSHFVSAEGFIDGLKNDFSRTISTPFRAQGDDVTFFYSASTSSLTPMLYDVLINGKKITTDTAVSQKTNKARIKINPTDLQDNNILRIKGQNTSLLLGLSHISMTYPRIFNMSNINFTTIKNPDNKERIIEFQELPNQITYLYDISQQKIVQSSPVSNKIYQIDPLGTLVYSAKTESITNIEKISSFNLNKNTNYLIISSKKLSKNQRAQEGLDRYKAYRSSPKGGRFNTEIAYVEDIYDHFGYGIPHHPHSFKNFAHYLKANYSSLEYVLLIGKGREYNAIRTKDQLNQASNQTFFIPTYGNSPSDILLFSKGEEAVPFFALGRIAAKNGDDINNYLDKVIEHDLAKEAPQTLDKMWLKNVIHLGGGANNGEQSAIKRFLDQMGDTLANSQYGAKINGFYKTTNAAVQSANTEALKKEMDNGVSIITFFGHASVGTFDYNLDNPNNYKNKGKYPFIFSLGCYSGNIHTSASGISEEFVLAKDRGAIGFIAASGTATLHSQGIYGVDYYSKMGNKFYGKSIGQMLNLIVEENKNVRVIDPFSFYQQLTLNGDPAVNLASFNKPDYTFISEKTVTEPTQIFTENGNFNLNVSIANIGRYTGDSIKILLSFEKDNSTLYSTESVIKSPKYIDTLILNIPLNESWIGEVKLKGQIFNLGPNAESSESNNTLLDSKGNAGIPIKINSNNIKNVYPYDNSIIGSIDELKLLAKTQNAFAGLNNYLIQIDTTSNFNSPLKQEKKFLNSTSFIEWTPTITLKENQTYYWRSSVISEKDDSKNSEIYSFTYIPNKRGWLVQKPQQFKKGISEDLEFDDKDQLSFKIVDYTLNIRSAQFQGEIIFNTTNGNKWGSITPFNGSSNTLNVIVWQKSGAKQNSGSDFNSIPWSSNTFVYTLSSIESRKGFMDLINSANPEDVIICYFNFLQSGDLQSFNQKDWESDTSKIGTSIYKFLRNYGALQIDQLKSGLHPYIFAFSKEKGAIDEILSNGIDNPVSTAIRVPTRLYEGSISSPTFMINQSSKEIHISHDNETKMDHYAYSSIYYSKGENSPFILYKEKLQAGKYDLQELLNLGAKFIRLKFETRHGGREGNGAIMGKNSPQLYKWMIINEEIIPDLFLSNGKLSKNEYYQGEPIDASIEIFNNSTKEIDNLDIRIDKLSTNNKISSIEKKIGKLKIGNNALNLQLDEKSDLGILGYFIEINPNKKINEITHKNNGSNVFIKVRQDALNPSVNVLFNGSPIINGDYVNKKPLIKITITDDNKYMLINKPEMIAIAIRDNKKNITNKVSLLNDKEVKFLPSKDTTNKASIEIFKEFEDGNYTLIINAFDGAGNVSGSQNYEVNFNVSSKSYVRNLTNFPNPFSSKTQFIYEIAGNVPEDFILQIYSMTGKVLREFRAIELGPIKNGRNISSISWDGTDEFGNKLANGVYLMKIKTKDSQEEFSTSTSNSYMKNGFSKLVIMR